MNMILLIKIIRKRFFYLKRVKEVEVSRLKTSFQKKKIQFSLLNIFIITLLIINVKINLNKFGIIKRLIFILIINI